MEDVQDILHRARAYPYDYPRHSFLFQNGEVLPFEPTQTDGRTPVLAFGSNQSPAQLTRKFGRVNHPIPVERVRLHDFDVVYSAHITSYGAVPAMMQHCPGTYVDVAISWLDDNQLDVMHQTELYAANYVFAALDDVTLHHRDTMRVQTVFAYVGEKGHLVHDDGAVSLLAIQAENRRWTARSTGEVLELVRRRVAPDRTTDQFILDLVADKDYRRSVTQAISQDETRFTYPYRIVERF